jgi:hypothetical protein
LSCSFYDKKKINSIKINSLKIRFKTWNDIYNILFAIKSDNKIDSFLVSQLIEYLEDNNMAEFNGWKQKDFDAFLFIEEDDDASNRKVVKKKFESFINKLLIELSKNGKFENMYPGIKTAINADTRYIWGNFVGKNKRNIDSAHLWLSISSDGILIGLNIEGAKPTRKFIEELNKNDKIFTKICKDLEGFTFSFRERKKIQVRNYKSIKQAEFRLGEKFDLIETKYIKSKSKKFDLIEININKTFKRDNKLLSDISFIEDCAKELDRLIDIYNFSNQ